MYNTSHLFPFPLNYINQTENSTSVTHSYLLGITTIYTTLTFYKVSAIRHLHTNTLQHTANMAVASSQQQKGFMSLPPEIRNEIYSYLLSMPAYSRYESKDAHVYPALLAANHKIHDEATDLLYGTNTFVAHPTMLAAFPRLRAWYDPIKESSVLPRIRRFYLQVRLDCDLPYEADAVTASFSGLDELVIDVVQAMYLGVGHGNLKKFEGVRGVGRVRIMGSTTGFDDYIQWLEKAMMSEPGTEVEPFEPVQQGWADRLRAVHI